MVDKNPPFRGEKYTDDDTQARFTLINFYDSKSRSHLTYLMTLTIAFVGFIVGQFNLFNINKMASAIIFIPLIIYFLGRAYYWALMATTANIARIYSLDYILYIYPDFIKYQYSSLVGLRGSTKDINLGVRDYNKINRWRRYFFKAFDMWNGKYLTIFLMIVLLIFFIYKNLIFIS